MRNSRRNLGMASMVVGLALVAAGLISSPVAGVAGETVPLHNSTADPGTDCPDALNDYWHFVVTPNDGTYTILSITLNVGGTSYTFPGTSPIILNGGQFDNVFVQVPAGESLGGLNLSGSSAQVDPAGATHFNLSHICDGSDDGSTTTTEQETTTTAEQETTTTEQETTTTAEQETTTTEQETTTTEQETTTTEQETTTTAEQETTTTAEQETTTTEQETTTTAAATTTIGRVTTTIAGGTSTNPSGTSPQGGDLPSTGGDSSGPLLLGAFFVIFGAMLLGLTRRAAVR